jgi:LysM repeat protein
MKSTSRFAFGAALAAAVLSSGCRTVHGQSAATGSVSSAEDSVEAKPVVLDASQVGTRGTYTEYVIAEKADGPTVIEANGLRGQTGRHVSPEPPTPDPAPAIVPVAPAAPGAASVYVVQEGDIFGRIAQKHGVSQKALLEANPGLKDPNRIHVGQKLNIPPRGTGLGAAAPKKAPAKKAAKKATLPPKAGYTVYVVQEGDILGRIANRNKTTVKALQEANGIADPTKLRAGTPIYVPSAAAPAPAPEEAAPAPAPAPAPVAPSEEANQTFLDTFAN